MGVKPPIITSFQGFYLPTGSYAVSLKYQLLQSNSERRMCPRASPNKIVGWPLCDTSCWMKYTLDLIQQDFSPFLIILWEEHLGSYSHLGLFSVAYCTAANGRHPFFSPRKLLLYVWSPSLSHGFVRGVKNIEVCISYAYFKPCQDLNSKHNVAAILYSLNIEMQFQKHHKIYDRYTWMKMSHWAVELLSI